MKSDPQVRPVATPILACHDAVPLQRVLPALLLLVAVAGLLGCGAQGVPHPPHLERPEEITDLAAVQIGQNLELHFSLPQHTTEGERLTKPLEIEILRAVAPARAGISRLPPPEVWVHLQPAQWLPYSHDHNISYSLHLTAPEFQEWRGQTLVVAVRTLTRGFRHRPLESDPSNFADVPVYEVSGPVAGVTCVATEKAIQVGFTPPSSGLNGGPLHDLAGYGVYRSLTGQPGTFELRGEISAPPYRDTEFEFGKSYYYRVRALFGRPGQLAMSDASSTVKITPRDIFPPAPPGGLSGIYTAGAVELVWTANTEPDLAGYNVYRREDRNFQRVNKELLSTPIFRDTTAPQDKALQYYVTAVDLSGNESKPSDIEEVETK